MDSIACRHPFSCAHRGPELRLPARGALGRRGERQRRPPPQAPPSDGQPPPDAIGAEPEPPEHRVRPHRRSLLEPVALHASRAAQMQREGLTFNDYFVSDSLCCPSRASIFTGNFPHDTGIYSNTGKHGGFDQFYARGEEQHTFADRAQARRLPHGDDGQVPQRLHGPAERDAPRSRPRRTCRPGGREWDVAGWGYPEFNYDAEPERQPAQLRRPAVGLPDRRARPQRRQLHQQLGARRASRSSSSWRRSRRTRPYTPAPRDANDFPGLTAPRPPSFNVLPVNAPALAGQPPAARPRRQIATINRDFRKRAQSVQAVDDMIGQIEATLAADGVAEQHLHRVQLGQRPAHGRVPADAGQDDRVRHRHPRAR